MHFSHTYYGKEDDTLTALRHKRSVAHYHSLRVHLQVSQWIKLDLKTLNPLDWRWENSLSRKKLTWNQLLHSFYILFAVNAKPQLKSLVILFIALVRSMDLSV